MKGTIHKCIEKLVTEKFGVDKWTECLKSVGLDELHTFLINDDVDEQLTMQLLQKMPNILAITTEQLFDAFGEYWVHSYAPKVYPEYYEGITSVKQFLLNIDNIHSEVVKNIPNARPPHFLYEEQNGSLVMTYQSDRGLVHLFISLAKGLASYYQEKIQVELIEKNKVRFTFEK